MRDSKTARQARLSAILAEEDRETSKEEGDSHGEKRKYLVNECLPAKQVSLSDENAISGNSSLPDIVIATLSGKQTHSEGQCR